MTDTRNLPPLVIDFVTGSSFGSDEHVLTACGAEVRLPADQVVLRHQDTTGVRVGLGGMSFEGMENDRLVFWRVRDLLPEEHLSPQREWKVTVDPRHVKTVLVQGRSVWPTRSN